MHLDLQPDDERVFRLSQPRILVAFVGLLLIVPVFVQGGYQEVIACAFGALASVGLLLACAGKQRRRCGRTSLVAPIFFLLACAYLLSMLFSAVCLTTLAETGFWFAVAAVAGLASMLGGEERDGVLRCFCWAGVAGAVLGILIFTGALTVFGTMDDGRLQFFFQYANTAAVWFGAAALLSLLSGDTWLKAVSPLPLLAAFLTQSGGGILAILAACVALCAYWWRAKRYEEILSAMCKTVATAAAFMCLLVTDGAIGLLAAAALVAFCLVSSKIDSRIEGLPRKHLICLLAAAAVLLCAVAAALFLQDRLAAAGYHFIERLIHVIDGLTLLASGPLFGMGPDQWQFAYPYVQSAQYHVIHAHCSYIQAAVDAGIVGLASLAAALAVGMRRCWARGEKAAVLVLGMLALHMLVDFDTQFAAFSFLMAFLLAEPLDGRLVGKDGSHSSEAEDGPHRGGSSAAGRSKATWAGFVAGLCCLAFCIVGFFVDSSKLAIEAASSRGDFDQISQLYSDSQLVQSDVPSQSAYMRAAYDAGELDPILQLYLKSGALSDEQALYVSMTLFEAGDPEVASLILVEEMERQPYNDALYQSAYVVFVKYGIHESAVSRYNAAVDNLNRLSQTGWSALLPDQAYLDIYL